jgi:hypothetical protein
MMVRRSLRRPYTGKRLGDEGIEDEAGFHVGYARTVGDVPVDPERAIGDGALGKDRIHMAEQQDVTVALEAAA